MDWRAHICTTLAFIGAVTVAIISDGNPLLSLVAFFAIEWTLKAIKILLKKTLSNVVKC